MRKRGRTGRRGTTIIEVLIAMAILAFVLLAFMSVMYSSATLSTSTREGAISTYELQAAFEDTFAPTYDTFTRTFVDGYTFPAQVYNRLPNEQVSLSVLNRDPDGNWVEYQIEVAWTDHKGNPQSKRMRTRRSR